MKKPVKIKAMILPPAEGGYGAFIKRLQEDICRAGRIPGSPMCPTRIKDDKMANKKDEMDVMNNNEDGINMVLLNNIENVMEANFGVDMRAEQRDGVNMVLLWDKERDERIGVQRVLSDVSKLDTYKARASEAEFLSRKYQREADECWEKALVVHERIKETVCVDVQYMDAVDGWIVSVDRKRVAIVELRKDVNSGVVLNVVEKLLLEFVHPDVFDNWTFRFHANEETPGGQSVAR
jgi:hypothetical protein